MAYRSGQAMTYHILLWKIFGLYDIAGNPLWFRIYKLIGLIAFYVLYPLGIFIQLFLTDNVNEMIDSLAILPSTFTYSKGFVIPRKRRELDALLALMERMDAHIKTEHQQAILDRQVQGSNNLVKVLAAIYYSTIFFNIIATLLAKPRRLMWHSYYPFDWQHTSSIFWFYSVYQIICSILVTTLYSSLDVYGSAMYRVLGAHLDILGDQIQALGQRRHHLLQKGSDDATMNKKFKQCIIYHTFCARYAALVNDILSTHFLVQFGISGIVFCGSEYKVSGLSPIDDYREFGFITLYMAAMMYQIFIPCYFGSIVIRKSDELLGKMYTSNWMDQSKEFKASLLIFGERAQKPIIPVAAGLFDVSLPTYVSVMKLAYSLMAFLKNVTGNK